MLFQDQSILETVFLIQDIRTEVKILKAKIEELEMCYSLLKEDKIEVLDEKIKSLIHTKKCFEESIWSLCNSLSIRISDCEFLSIEDKEHYYKMFESNI